ncbi:hypothetical protein HO173_005900 [Letharia columbiana]|uniref:Uncharacterized protein n=1 Tax=Letharia columbiana TaxID=112416 RepID=A0A8H6FVV0_9LECA|nr:uncharacterized protein HO173_009887 [Letharia columbiana]XP_037165072.1 uncharacterized protein HO173_005900 [Letharia columbiana]KAF6232050.1 hypothetical protein HO173_009887 [Letharia columbiana]KAF6235705.1 hypothetical protein HO173_005900 [Letharia columbiana]
MKQTAIAAAFLAAGATAQNSTSTRTEYYNTCSISSGGIVTAAVTETYCPPCEAAGMTTFAGGSLTTYTTKFLQVCPTGLAEATYTVTEPCPSTGLARGSGYVPQGFTVTTVPCSVCEAGKSQYAQTTPGPALASALAAPAPAPTVPTALAKPGSAAPPAAAGAPAAGAPAAPAAAGAASPANAENAAVAPGAAAPAESGAASPAESGAASPAESGAASPAENGAAAPAESGAAAPAESGAASPAESGAASPAENGAASPAENGAAAPAGSSAGAPASYPLPSQAGQVALASGAPASNGNSTVPFKGAASLVSAIEISSFITVLVTLITGFAFVL